MLLYLFDKHQLLIPSEMHYNYLHMNYYLILHVICHSPNMSSHCLEWYKLLLIIITFGFDSIAYYILNYFLYVAISPVCIVYCILYIVYCILFIVYCLLHIFLLYIVCCIFFIVHCIFK